MTVGILLIAVKIVVRQTVLGLIRAPARRETIAHRYSAARTYFFFANLLGFALCLLVLGWGFTATRLGMIRIDNDEVLAPAGELLILAPFLAAQIGSWFFFYDADRVFHSQLADPQRAGRFWSRRGYVLFMLRQQLVMVFAPLLLIMTQQGLERLFPEMMSLSWLPLASIFVLPAFLIFFPLFMPLLLGLRPLQRGPIRDRLEANARRLRFDLAQIYHWDTRGAVANALVVGIVPSIRYVVFTDRLLDELSEDETDAVFGHEVGHAHYGHIPYYMLFLMLSFILLSATVHVVATIDEMELSQYRTSIMIAPVVLIGAYMFSVFGFVSRRCERQADIFGCRAGSCLNHGCGGHDSQTPLAERGQGLCMTGIAAFIRALRRVEEINGMVRPWPVWRGSGVLGKLNWIFRLLTGWLHTWQHSTIPKRIAFLHRIAGDAEIERRFQHRVWALKCLVIVFLAGSIIGLGVWKGWNVLLMGN
jgi:Zn-dependent protease with chaperone function